MAPSFKVLIVDDDAFVLETMRALLELADFNVITRNTAFGTSQVVLQHRPDAVLLDVDMPGLGGPDLARLLAEMPRISVAVVLFSGMDRAELKELALQCGAFGFLQKTMEPARLVAELRALLVRWGQRTPVSGVRVWGARTSEPTAWGEPSKEPPKEPFKARGR